jgi:hypothetical protein
MNSGSIDLTLPVSTKQFVQSQGMQAFTQWEGVARVGRNK